MRGGAFVCHAARDAGTAQRVVAVLEAAGVACWIAPRDIEPGESWSSAIVDGLEAAPAVVLVFSAATNDSPHVTRELETAVHRRIPIVPVRLEPVEPSSDLRYFIGTSQWLDTGGVGAEQWEPPLVRAVRRAVGSRPPRTRQVTAIRDPDPSDPTPPPRRFLPWAVAGGALVLVVTVAVVLLTRGGSEEVRPAGSVPDGRAGMASVFPSLTDGCELVEEPQVEAKSEVYACRSDDHVVRYSRWPDGYDRLAFFTSYMGPDPKAWIVHGTVVGSQWTYEAAADDFNPYRWAATYEDLPFSVEVEATSAHSRVIGISEVEAAAPDDVGRE